MLLTGQHKNIQWGTFLPLFFFPPFPLADFPFFAIWCQFIGYKILEILMKNPFPLSFKTSFVSFMWKSGFQNGGVGGSWRVPSVSPKKIGVFFFEATIWSSIAPMRLPVDTCWMMLPYVLPDPWLLHPPWGDLLESFGPTGWLWKQKRNPLGVWEYLQNFRMGTGKLKNDGFFWKETPIQGLIFRVPFQAREGRCLWCKWCGFRWISFCFESKAQWATGSVQLWGWSMLTLCCLTTRVGEASRTPWRLGWFCWLQVKSDLPFCDVNYTNSIASAISEQKKMEWCGPFKTLLQWAALKISPTKSGLPSGSLTYHLMIPWSHEVFPVLASPADAEPVASCEEHGVLGPIVGTVGSLAALEAIKVCETHSC